MNLANGFFTEAFPTSHASQDFNFGTPFATSKFAKDAFETNNIFDSASKHEEQMFHHQEMPTSKITLNQRNLRQPTYYACKTPLNQNNVFNFQKSKPSNTPEMHLKKFEFKGLKLINDKLSND